MMAVTVWLFYPFFIVAASSLPPYIVPCPKDDPEITRCFVEHGNDAIPHLIPGDRKYNFPPLDPLRIVEASIATESLSLNLSEVSVYGFATTRLIDATIDLATLTSVEVIAVTSLAFAGKYEIDGRILNWPVWGEGTANLTFVRPIFNFTWQMGTVKKEEVVYAKVLNVSMHYDLERAVYDIDNLYNGDKDLGRRMNAKLNENWKALHEEFSPVLSALIVKVARRLGDNILSMVPLEDIFV